MSATGDHQVVKERIPHCQRLIKKGAMHCVRRYFLSQPLERIDNMLTIIAQIVVSNHNERAGKPYINSAKSLDALLISAGHGDSSPYLFMVRA